MAICVTRIYRGLSMANECQCTRARLDISTVGPPGVSCMRFASNHPPDSGPSGTETLATESITITVLEEEQHHANETLHLNRSSPQRLLPEDTTLHDSDDYSISVG